MAATIERVRELRELVDTLVELRDEIGVLSVTVGVEPGPTAGSTPAWEIALRNDLASLRKDGVLEGSLGREADERLAVAVDPALPGRGRAFYLGLASGESVEAVVPEALPTGARVGPVAHVLPLLAVLEQGATAGFLAASRDGISVSECELGLVRDLDRIELEPWVGDWWPEMKGPARANPTRGQQTVSQRDRYARRLSEAYRHTLQDAAAELGALAGGRGWVRAVLAGDPRLVTPVGDVLRAAGVTTTSLGANLDGLRPEDARERLVAALGALVVEQSATRARSVVETAAAGTSAVLGLGPVVAALNEARVGALVLDTGREYPGSVAADGLLSVGEQDDDDLTDVVVERALSTGAVVTPVSGEAAAALDGCGGIGATLRW